MYERSNSASLQEFRPLELRGEQTRNWHAEQQ